MEDLSELAENGNQNTQCFPCSLYRDGGLLIPDDKRSACLSRRAAEGGHVYAAYAPGKLLQSQEKREAGVEW